jgi:hypothetical protein
MGMFRYVAEIKVAVVKWIAFFKEGKYLGEWGQRRMTSGWSKLPECTLGRMIMSLHEPDCYCYY